MKSEPLSNKLKKYLVKYESDFAETIYNQNYLEFLRGEGKLVECFLKEDVKSAVQGLLEEVESQKGLIKICDVCRSPNKIDNVIIVDTLKGLIKKYFKDVIQDDS